MAPEVVAYLKKARRVSISALHEYFYGDNVERRGNDQYSINRLLHRAGDKMDADLLTKGFDFQRHWLLCRMIGMAEVPMDAIEEKRLRQLAKQSANKRSTQSP